MDKRNKLDNLKPFPPGVSGNPKGAPKGKRWRTIFREMLELAAQVPAAETTDERAKLLRKLHEDLETYLGRKPTNRDLIAFRQILKAQDGDTYAFIKIAEREEGMPTEEIEVHDSDFGEDQPVTADQLPDLVRVARGEVRSNKEDGDESGS